MFLTERSTYDAIGGVGSEGELVVSLVVLVQQICGKSDPKTISKPTEENKPANSTPDPKSLKGIRGEGGARWTEGHPPLVFLPISV